MEIATQQRLLYALAGGCLLGTACAAYWSLAGVDVEPIAATGPATSPRSIGADAQDPLADANHLAIPLRGPLYDPPPTRPPVTRPKAKPKQAPKVVRPSLDLTLVGTLLDPKEDLAILSDSSGKFDISGVGQVLDLSPAGVEITAIGSESVTLRFEGEETTVKLNRKRRGNNRRRNQ